MYHSMYKTPLLLPSKHFLRSKSLAVMCPVQPSCNSLNPFCSDNAIPFLSHQACSILQI